MLAKKELNKLIFEIVSIFVFLILGTFITSMINFLLRHNISSQWQEIIKFAFVSLSVIVLLVIFFLVVLLVILLILVGFIKIISKIINKTNNKRS
jgi:hypothetical protein